MADSPFQGVKDKIESSLDRGEIEVDEYERVSTGVDGLDQLLHGGLPKGNFVLIPGPAGSGKTTLGLHFLIEGAKNGEEGLYVSLDEDVDDIKRNAKAMGLKIDKEEVEDKINFIRPELYSYDKLKEKIEVVDADADIERLVFDSVTILGYYFDDKFKLRKRIIDLNRMLRRIDATALATSEMSGKPHEVSHFGVEEFVTDGVIQLFNLRKKDAFVRGVAITKMRGTSHSNSLHPLTIGRGGIQVFPEEKMFGALE